MKQMTERLFLSFLLFTLALHFTYGLATAASTGDANKEREKYVIPLHTRRIAPAPGVESGARGREYVLVQFWDTPSIPEAREMFAKGITIVRPFYDTTYVAKLDLSKTNVDALKALSWVRWVGYLHPEDKVIVPESPGERKLVRFYRNNQEFQMLRVNFHQGVAWEKEKRIRDEFSPMKMSAPKVLQARPECSEAICVPTVSIMDLATRDEVFSLDSVVEADPLAVVGVSSPASPSLLQGLFSLIPRMLQLNTSTIWNTAADDVISNVDTRGYMGDGQAIYFEYEGYPATDHPMLQGRVFPENPNSPGLWHINGVIGAAIGSVWTSSGHTLRGLAPRAWGYWGNNPTIDPNVHLCVSTNSTFNAASNNYSSETAKYMSGAQIMDSYAHEEEPTGVWTNRLFQVRPTGNSGYGKLLDASGATSKNVLTVGTRDENPLYYLDGKSPGPTRDGRLKPELVVDASRVNLPDGLNSVQTQNATSFASPQVAGAVTLLYQAWNHRVYDYQRYQNERIAPRQSTIRALLIETCKDLIHTNVVNGIETVPPERKAYVGPDYNTGYGLLQIDKALDLLIYNAPANRKFLEGTLNDNSTDEFKIQVPAGLPKLVVTLAWDDYPGNHLLNQPIANYPPQTVSEIAARQLVNDLDLVLIDPSGNVKYPFRPNDDAKLTVNSVDYHYVNIWAAYLRGPTNYDGNPANRYDTIEQVVENDPRSGPWTVRISGKIRTGIVTDGYSITPDVSFGPIGQRYSLVCNHESEVAGFGFDFQGEECFTLTNEAGDRKLASIQSQGALVLKSKLFRQRGDAIVANPEDFLIADGATTLLKIDRITGAMEIKGSLTENAPSVTVGADAAFALKDNNGDPICALDAQGNLTLKGGLFEHAAP